MTAGSDAYMKGVGRRLRALREQAGLSLMGAEAAWGLHAARIGSYERAERALSVATLHYIASVAGVTVESLLPPTGGSPLLDSQELACALRRAADKLDAGAPA